MQARGVRDGPPAHPALLTWAIVSQLTTPITSEQRSTQEAESRITGISIRHVNNASRTHAARHALCSRFPRAYSRTHSSSPTTALHCCFTSEALPRMAYRFCLTVLAILSWAIQSHQRSIGANGAVTSEVELCSKVGIDLLRDGGNAADAVSYLYRRNIAI
jgi:hypothetical protein